LVSKWHMKTDNIRLGKQVLKSYILEPQLFFKISISFASKNFNLHFKCPCKFADSLPNFSEAYKSENLAIKPLAS